MIAAVVIGLRASVVVLCALGATVVLRKRSASLRHWVLAGGLFAAATVAPLSYALPSWDIPSSYASAFDVLPQPSGGRSQLAASAPFESVTSARRPTASERFSIELTVNAVWLGGFIVALAIVLGRIIRIAYVTGRATPVIDPRWRSDVIALKTSVPGIVGTWGWWRPCLLLPDDCESWTDDRVRVVLGHELAHIRRGDWIVQIASEFVRAVFWYNPLFWIACARLRRESEQAADDAVLEGGVPATEYASHLLELARAYRSPVSALVLPVARPSTLEWRIAAMLNASLIRRRPTRRMLAVACAVLAIVTLSASSFRAAAAVQPMPLTGTVYDMTGGVLPAAQLTLENEAGTHLTATTDRNGYFDFGVTAPGKYTLGAVLAGFQTMKQDLSLDARGFNRSITMQVGTLQETVTLREQRKDEPPPPPAPLRMGGNLRAPNKIRDVHPIYPEAMRDAGIEGDVSLGAVIGVDGRVTSVRGISASAHPALTQAAIDAVRQWEFTPTLLNGQAVEVFMTVTVKFSLED